MGEMDRKIDLNLYRGRRVFLSGHTGFKGAWLYLWLRSLGADVLAYALPPDTEPSLFREMFPENPENSVLADILDSSALNSVMSAFRPEIVFHLAAQPLVRRSYLQPVRTYASNVMGTLNVLEAARACGSVKAFVNVTTDKCYENRETGEAYSEGAALGGYDMYSSSKACSEILSASYRRSFLKDGFALATARAGNVIGGGDWAEDRLVPDCMRALFSGKDLILRNPDSVRPWQHVLEPLSGYLLLGALLFARGSEYAEAFNFGPEPGNVLKVKDVVSKITDKFSSANVRFESASGPHEAKLLTLKIDKAKRVLNWEPVYGADEAVEKTVEWYKSFYGGAPAKELVLEQIAEFKERAPFFK